MDFVIVPNFVISKTMTLLSSFQLVGGGGAVVKKKTKVNQGKKKKEERKKKKEKKDQAPTWEIPSNSSSSSSTPTPLSHFRRLLSLFLASAMALVTTDDAGVGGIRME